MEQRDAIELLRPAVGQAPGMWADFGAGTGTFTRALATILGAGSRVFAVDRDARALAALRALEVRNESGASIVAVEGDLQHTDAISLLADVRLDGAIFANALHFVADLESALAGVVERVRVGGRVVVIEYERDAATQWVPYPVPFARLQHVARAAGLTTPEIVARRPSSFRGTMYCAAADRTSAHTSA